MFDKLTEDMKAAMKSGDKLKLATLRMLISELKNLKIAKGGINSELSEDDIITVLQRELKKRIDAAKAFKDAGRIETSEKEEAEADILREYLPAALSDEETEAAVVAAIAESGATSKREMGNVMKLVMAKHKGKIDGKKVQGLVAAKLP